MLAENAVGGVKRNRATATRPCVGHVAATQSLVGSLNGHVSTGTLGDRKTSAVEPCEDDSTLLLLL